MSDRANKLPDGWRRDRDGVAYHAASGLQILPAVVRDIDGSVARHAFAVVDRDGNNVPRPRYFRTEGEAIGRVKQLVAFEAVAEPAPEPWTPKDGERVRVAMEDGTEVVCTVEDARPHLGTVVGVRFPGEDKRRLVRREYVCSHAAPAPDPRDAEIERLRVQVGEQSREIERLTRERDQARSMLAVREATIQMACDRLEGEVEGRPPGSHNFLQRIDELVEAERRGKAAIPLRIAVRGYVKAVDKGQSDHQALFLATLRRLLAAPSEAELAANPAAAALSAEERERIAYSLRPIMLNQPHCNDRITWEQVSPDFQQRYLKVVDTVAAALQPDPARAAEAEAALRRQEWIEAKAGWIEAKAGRIERFGNRRWAADVKVANGFVGVAGYDTFAAAIDAAMENHPLTREGE